MKKYAPLGQAIQHIGLDRLRQGDKERLRKPGCCYPGGSRATGPNWYGARCQEDGGGFPSIKDRDALPFRARVPQPTAAHRTPSSAFQPPLANNGNMYARLLWHFFSGVWRNRLRGSYHWDHDRLQVTGVQTSRDAPRSPHDERQAQDQSHRGGPAAGRPSRWPKRCWSTQRGEQLFQAPPRRRPSGVAPHRRSRQCLRALRIAARIVKSRSTRGGNV